MPSTSVTPRTTITVTNTEARVDHDPIVLNEPDGEQADWHNTEAFPVTIRFAVSPFEKDRYEIPAKGHTSSGPIRKNIPHCHNSSCPWPYQGGHKGNSEKGHYKYSIWKGNEQLADPEVVIKP